MNIEFTKHIKKHYIEDYKDMSNLTEKLYARNIWNDPVNRMIIEKIKNLGYDLKNKKVLIIGAGYGHEAVSFLNEGCEVFCIDLAFPNNESLPWLRKCHLCITDAHIISFTDNSFDFIYSQHMLACLANRHQAIDEIKRVLKEDGLYIINEIMNNSFYMIFLRKILPLFVNNDLVKWVRHNNYISYFEIENYALEFNETLYKKSLYFLLPLYYLFKILKSRKLFSLLFSFENNLKFLNIFKKYGLFGVIILKK